MKRIAILAVLTIQFLFVGKSIAFDTGHHWEITSQSLRELGFSDDARNTVCVSNWLVDYYSSSPTACKETREILSKLHCDNLHNGAAVQQYMSQFTRNARAAIRSQKTARERLLMLGAILHVAQDLYSHSTWIENHTSKEVLTNHTLGQAGGYVPSEVLTGAYEPPDYVSGHIDHDHPEHGSYEGGIHKASHQRELWEHANFLAYCTSIEFTCAVRGWLTAKQWQEMKNLKLGPIARQQLNQEAKAAYGVSIWIAVAKQHGHWKGGGSGYNLFFVKSVLQFAASLSRNSRWYRVKKGFAPLAKNLYKQTCNQDCPPCYVPGLNIQRNVVSLRFQCVRELGSLDPLPCQSGADMYAIGAVYYGIPCRTKDQTLLDGIVPEYEPKFPINGDINTLFRDSVIQNKSKVCRPWAVLAMLDPQKLCDHNQYITFYIRVGEEDCFRDDVADISSSCCNAVKGCGSNAGTVDDRGVLMSYHIPTGEVTNVDTGEVLQRNSAGLITIRGDHPTKSVQLSMKIENMPVNHQ